MASLEEIVQNLIVLSRWLGDPAHDYAILGEGNTSARCSDDTFLVKASGKHLGSIEQDGFCEVRFDRALAALNGPDLSDAEVRAALLHSKADASSAVMPSVETFFHAFLLTLPGVQYVGHCHPAAVNSVLCARGARAALEGRLFPDEIVCCGPAPCFIEYTDPGIPLARHVRARFIEYEAEYGEWPKMALMQNHGLIALGKTMGDVQTVTAMAVKTARILLGTFALGGPNFLTPQQVNRIHTRPDEHYRRKQLEDAQKSKHNAR